MALLVLVAVADEASAAHYQGGEMGWAPTGNGREARLVGQTAWRCSAFVPNPCLPTIIGAIIPTGFSIDWGDGSPCTPASMMITHSYGLDDWFVGSFVDAVGNALVHSYASPGPPGPGTWTVKFCGPPNARAATSGGLLLTYTHINNPNDNFQLETKVSFGFVPFPDGSPRLTMPLDLVQPLVHYCVYNTVCLIPIVAFDSTPVTFRLATSAEVEPGGAFVQPGPPDSTYAATIDPATGLFRWDTRGATLSASTLTFYSAAIVAEDADSKTTLDFVIRLVCTPAVGGVPSYCPIQNPCTPLQLAGGLCLLIDQLLDPCTLPVNPCVPPLCVVLPCQPSLTEAPRDVAETSRRLGPQPDRRRPLRHGHAHGPSPARTGPIDARTPSQHQVRRLQRPMNRAMPRRQTMPAESMMDGG